MKDVEGLYEADPASRLAPRRFLSVSWEDARLLGGGAVQFEGGNPRSDFGTLSFDHL